jgi:phosphoribosylglycinamide formyltransferase 1
MSEPLRLAILISGRGSNMAAIARACADEQLDALVDIVISDRADAGGLEIARALGIATAVVPWKSLTDRAAAEQVLAETLDAHRPDVIVLAGFMRILSAKFVARYAGRMLNIHPSLLPQYQGLHTHRRVLEAGDAHHGASVHFVTEELDGGPVVLQARVPVMPGDTEAAISGRVQKAEHIIYPRVIGWLAEKRLVWRDGQPWLDNRPLLQPLVEDFRGH